MQPGLCNCACRRIRPERLVIAPAIVVARDPESTRRPKDEERRRKRQPDRPPRGLRPEPAMWRTAEDFRRVEGRKIRSKVIILSLKCRPRRIDDECRQAAQ